MADNITTENSASVEAFLNGVADVNKRRESFTVLELMKKATGLEPKMWGSAIVGFGRYHYKYESGHEGNSCLTGFSPRKVQLTIYCLTGFPQQDELLSRLGKHTTGKVCLYIKKLADVDLAVLEEIVRLCVEDMRAKYGAV